MDINVIKDTIAMSNAIMKALKKYGSSYNGKVDIHTVLTFIHNDFMPLPLDSSILAEKYFKYLGTWDNDDWPYDDIYISVDDLYDILNGEVNFDEKITVDVGDGKNPRQCYFLQINKDKVLLVSHETGKEDTLKDTLKGYLEEIKVLSHHT